MSKAKGVVQVAFALIAALAMVQSLAEEPIPAYRFDAPSRDGIGKFYMGREISHVMGHQGAAWLERADRQREERTDLVIKHLPVEDDSVVVDIGAGTGYFAFPIAARVPNGRVYAVDIQQEMLDIIKSRRTSTRIDNVEPVLGSVTALNLSDETVDLAFVVDAYHEFSHPLEMGQSIFAALKPGGRFVLIEYRAEDRRVPIKKLHKMSEKQVIREMDALGFMWERTENFLPQQHFIVFKKPVS